MDEQYQSNPMVDYADAIYGARDDIELHILRVLVACSDPKNDSSVGDLVELAIAGIYDCLLLQMEMAEMEADKAIDIRNASRNPITDA